jgi:hypothetical protein
MNNSNNSKKLTEMKKDLHLTASVDKPDLLEDMVEKLATRRYDIGYSRASVPNTWQAVDSSSIESYMSGTVEFDYNDRQRIRIPYITCFLFSCTKSKNDPYDVRWSISLS